MAEPIKFTDLIQPDDTINELIQQLREAKKTYEDLLKSVKEQSSEMVKSLNGASGATEEGKQKILELAAAADRLAMAEKAVRAAVDGIQQSEKGLTQAQKEAASATASTVNNMEELRKELEKAKQEAAENTKRLQEQAKAQKQVAEAAEQNAKAQRQENKEVEHAADSYKALKRELKELDKLFKTLSELDRLDPEIGGELAAEIIELKKALKDIDAMLTPHVSKMSELEKAQKAYAFATSDAGKEVAWLKAQTAAVNKEYITSRSALQHAIGSYNSLKATLKQLSAEYKAMSASDRQGPGGQALLTSILETKTAMAQLEAQMKPYTQALTQLEKAKQKLAYLQSEEGRELMEIRAQINAIVAERRKQEQILTDIEKAKRKLNFAQSEENMELKLYTTQIQEANRVAELRVRIANSEEGSYNRLSAQYALNKIRLNQMGEADEKAAQAKRELEKETNDLYQQMIKLQEATGNHTLSVGNYKKAWNGLGMAVNQIVREIPSAAISLNTFFLAISNNVPILMDEINKVRTLNAKLRADGEPTKNVIKEVTKALFSWNTVMVALLTVFAMQGQQIIEWITTLFKGEARVLSLTARLKALNTELKNSSKSYGENYVAFRKLADQYNSFTSEKEKLAWIKSNTTEFNNLNLAINDVNDADTAFITHTSAVLEALKLRARATAAESLAADKYAEELTKREEARLARLQEANSKKALNNLTSYSKNNIWAKYNPAGPATSFATKSSADMIAAATLSNELDKRKVESLEKQADAAKAAADAFYDMAEADTAAYQAALKSLGLFNTGNRDPKTPNGPRLRDTEDTLDSLSLAATKAYQKSVTKLEREEIKKRRKEYLAAYNTEVADLANKYNKIQRILDGQDERYKKLTDEQRERALKAQDDIIKTIENKQEGLSQDLALLSYAQQEQNAETQLEALNLQIAAVREGSEEELRLRMQILRVEEQIALARNKQLPPSQQQDENAIKASFKAQRAETVTAFNTANFDQQQALEQAKFEAVKHNEQQITLFTLQQEKERWEYQIRLAESGALEWSQVQIDAAKATVKGLNQQIKDIKSFIARVGDRGFEGALFESFGWNEEQIAAMTQATGVVIDQFGAILEAEIALAEKEKELADKRVENAQSVLEAEIEARNNGYANNVDSARKQLELERRNQQQKLKILEQAQKRQESLNTITQASSLITASANLWSAFSSIPFVGPALALAAIATMWGSFAAAKIKARQVTATQTEEYGEGGLEFLEGGSHASGNDIDLGVSNRRKRRMKAEGGEALAIINRRQTRKYHKVLPDIISSINKGMFEDRYLSAFNSDNQNYLVNVNQKALSQADFYKIEAILTEIKKQGDTKVVARADGAIVEINNNSVRVIKP